MAKLLAVEWDAQELRVVTGHTHLHSFRVDQVSVEPLGGEADTTEIGRVLAAVLTKLGAKISPVIALSRRSVEMRPIQLPMTPGDEQPELVRFQAPREFSAYDDTWRLDFVEVARSESNVEVLAAALAPDRSAEVAEICLPSQISPKRLVLRPLAAAELVHGLPSARRIIVDPASGDADLIVHNGKVAIAVRNVRLPAETAARADAIRNELKRTIALARVRFGNEEVEEVVVLGGPEEHAFWLEGWTPPIAVRHVDPLPAGMSPQSGRFASLVGALQAEAALRRPAIDLLNPRRKPKPKSRYRRTAVLGVAAVLALLAASGLIVSQLKAKDREIKRLALDLSTRKTKLVPEALKIVEMRNSVRKYFERDANWLDELRHVSANVPQDPEAVRLTKWVGRANDRTDTELHLEGGATTSGTIDVMEASLRVKGRKVSGGGNDYDENKMPRPYRFRDKIDLARNSNPSTLR